MKIKKDILKKARQSVSDCKCSLIESIIELCRSIDRKESGYILFGELIALTETKGLKKSGRFTSETRVADGILYPVDDGFTKIFIIKYESQVVVSSSFLSVDNLLKVYEALVKVARNE